jgi:protoheme IX farnesyltransferase
MGKMKDQTISHHLPIEGVRWQQGLRSLVSLTKPGVMAVLVFTALATAWAASGPWTSPARLALLALAGGLTAGGAAALNQYFERDLDAMMSRTSLRPLPTGRLPMPEIALAWGLFLSVTGIVLSALTLPQEVTFFIVLGLVIYIPVYTWRLKLKTPLNVVIGGAAGSCPVLAGWALARGDWPLTPWALAALVFFWTPAHFWAYAMVHAKSYQQAGIPMLPAVIGPRATPPYIFAHAFLTVLVSMLAFTGLSAVIAGISGAALLLLCVALWRDPTTARAWRVYKFSNYYLILVFLGPVLSAFVRY